MNLYLDIETLPNQDDFAKHVFSAGEDLPDSLTYLSLMKVRERQKLMKTALSGAAGRTYVIGLALNDGPWTCFSCPSDVDVYYDGVAYRDHEEILLDGFFDYVRTLESQCQATPDKGTVEELLFVGHNVIDFDLRFLWQRSVMLGRKCPLSIIKALESRYPRNCYDTMREWSGWRNMVSLEKLALESHLKYGGDEEVTGSELFELFLKGDQKAIFSKNTDDVEAVRKLYMRMTGRTASGV